MANLNCNCSAGQPTKTLKNLRDRLARRLGFAAQIDNLPSGMSNLLNDFLQSAQEQIYLRLDQPSLNRLFSWTLVVGERFYGVTTNDEQSDTSSDYCNKILEPLKIESVWVKDANGAFHPLTKGISPGMYTNTTQGRPYAYDIRGCIEVFPVPDVAETLYIEGDYGLLSFTGDDDTVTIDPEAVFLLALANAKSHYQQSDAKNYFAQATDRIGQLTAGAHATSRYVPNAAALAPATQPRMDTFIE